MDNKKYVINDFELNCLLINVKDVLKSKTIQKNKKLQNLFNSILCLACGNDKTEHTKDLQHDIFEILEMNGLYK